METKSLKKLHHDLSWSTRFYVLLTFLVVVGATAFKAWETDWALTIVGAIAGVLLVESFAISFQSHPKIWRAIRWILLLILLTFILLGTTY